MKIHNSEILIYYNPESSSGKKTVAYAHSLGKNVITYEFGKGPATGVIWRKLLGMLNLHPKEILDKSHPYYQEFIRGKEFDDEGWLNVLMFSPFLIKAPIAISGKKAVLCLTATDIYRLEQQV